MSHAHRYEPVNVVSNYRAGLCKPSDADTMLAEGSVVALEVHVDGDRTVDGPGAQVDGCVECGAIGVQSNTRDITVRVTIHKNDAHGCIVRASVSTRDAQVCAILGDPERFPGILRRCGHRPSFPQWTPDRWCTGAIPYAEIMDTKQQV